MSMTRPAFGRTALAAAATATLAAAVGCAETTTNVVVTASAEAFVRDDPNEPSGSGGSGDGSDYSGTAAGDFRAEVRSDTEGWVRLGSLNGITLQLQSGDGGTTVHGRVSVPASSYARARLVLRDVELTVKAGSVVGDRTLTTDAKVQLASGQEVVIERSVGPVSATGEADLEVNWDLNSKAWLTESVLEAGSVSGAELQEHATVTASTG